MRITRADSKQLSATISSDVPAEISQAKQLLDNEGIKYKSPNLPGNKKQAIINFNSPGDYNKGLNALQRYVTALDE